MTLLSVCKTDAAAIRAGIDKALEKYIVFAPVWEDDKLDYAEITNSMQVALTDGLPYKSPKDVVLPRVEQVMRFTADAAYEAQDIKPILLLGAKPCDVQALLVLDEVFAGDKGRFKDNFYINRRSALTIVGLACIEKKSACFCDERGIDKAFAPYCDGFLTPARDGSDAFAYEALTEKGEGLFSGTEMAAPARAAAPAETMVLNCEEEEVFEPMPWSAYAEGCIGCGTCTYICPTCHCFVLRDVDDMGVVSRTRLWDSCMYPNFTLHAGGHNPRSAKKDRYRQRVLHKYLYIPKNFDVTSCTGCGRCIRSCPGGINIRETVKDMVNRLAAPAAPANTAEEERA